MNNPRQILLDLGHRNAMGREDFMIAPSNVDAAGWIDRWPAWPAPALIIYGPPASGKTHLGAVWQTRSKQTFIDDADKKVGNLAFEEDLFHLYNIAKEEGGNILISATRPQSEWNFVLPDLASRLKSCPNVEIQPPDDTLLAAMLIKLFHDRQITIGAEIISYILPRIERSYMAARTLVERADHAAMEDKKAITIPLLSKLLSLGENDN